MATDNYGSFQPVGTVAATDIIPLQKADQNRKMTAAELAAYIFSVTQSGSFTGTFNGDLTADMLFFGPGDEVTTSGGAIPDGSFVLLNKSDGALAKTVAPSPGYFLIISQKDTGTSGHTLTTVGTFDGTNNTATFNAQYETLVLFALSSTRWIIIGNFGSVGLSAV